MCVRVCVGVALKKNMTHWYALAKEFIEAGTLNNTMNYELSHKRLPMNSNSSHGMQ